MLKAHIDVCDTCKDPEAAAEALGINVAALLVTHAIADVYVDGAAPVACDTQFGQNEHGSLHHSDITADVVYVEGRTVLATRWAVMPTSRFNEFLNAGV